MRYRIKDVLHSGTKGTRGKSRSSEDAYSRKIGRIVDIDWGHVRTGQPVMMNYIEDSDGTDMLGLMFITSSLVYLSSDLDGCELETRNSIFILEKV